MRYLFSKINLYVSKMFLKWTLICMLGMTAIITLFEVIEMFRRLMSRPHVSFNIAAEVVLLKLPNHFHVLLPLIILASTMLTLWKLNKTSELTVIRAHGISLWQIISGLVLATSLMGGFYLTILNPIKATLTDRIYFLEDRYFGTQHNALFVNPLGIWLKDIQGEYHVIFHAQQADMTKGEFQDVSLYFFDDEGKHFHRYIAEKAFLIPGQWDLKNIFVYDESGLEEKETLQIPTTISLDTIKNHHATPETLSLWKIPEHIRMLEAAGLSSLPYVLYLLKQWAIFGMLIVMVFLATAFSVRPMRFGGSGILVALGLGTGLVFYFLTDFSYALGLGGRLPPLASTFAPVIFGLLLGSALLLHIEEGSKKY